MAKRASLIVGGGFAVMLGLVIGMAMIASTGVVQSQCDGADGGPAATGQPPLVQYYIGAAQRYHLGPQGYAYLAAINEAETSFGTNMATSSTGATGWMAFEPGTWATWGTNVGDPGGQPDPYNPEDAIYAAARLLQSFGAPNDWPVDVFDYNHGPAAVFVSGDTYVERVTGFESGFAGSDGLKNLRSTIAGYWSGRAAPQWPAPAGGGAGAPQFVDAPVSGGESCCPSTGATTTATATATATTSTSAPTSSPPPATRADRTRVALTRSRPTPTGTGTQTTSTGTSTSAIPSGCANLTVGVRTVPGNVAVIAADGLAQPPANAPRQVQAMIAAGDRIRGFPYVYAGGHADVPQSDSQTDPQPSLGGYDCSGSTAYVMFGGGLGPSVMGISPDDSSAWVPASSTMETWGLAGKGRWVTWYANPGHVFIAVAGVVMDTAHYAPTAPAGSGPRWQYADIIPEQIAGDRPYGWFDARHPEGL